MKTLFLCAGNEMSMLERVLIFCNRHIFCNRKLVNCIMICYGTGSIMRLLYIIMLYIIMLCYNIMCYNIIMYSQRQSSRGEGRLPSTTHGFN